MLFSLTYDPYVALIGDVRDSRSLQHRAEVQKKLQIVLAAINGEYSDAFASKMTITLGDEFQGLFYNGAHIMPIIGNIQRRMYPVNIRFGIGIGGMTTSFDYERAIGADGPAYHQARDAINFLKENEKKNAVGKKEIRLECDECLKDVVHLLNASFSLMTVIRQSWTPRQQEVIAEMNVRNDKQSEVALYLGVQQSTVHRILMSANYYSYKEAMDAVQDVLSQVRGKHV